MSTPYIGPERRKGERRRGYDVTYKIGQLGPERRGGRDRRQEALAGIIIGLDADAIKVLAEVWRSIEAKVGRGGLKVGP